MTPSATSVIYTQDAELVRRARAYLRTTSPLRHVSDPDRLDSVLQQAGPCVLMMDLRSKDCHELIDQIQNEQSEILIIAFGVAQPERLREAEQFGVYAAEDLGLERRRFQALLGRAFDYLKVSQENRDLRETSTMPPQFSASREPNSEPTDASRAFPLLRFPRVLRRLDNIDALVASIVEALADAAGVSRVGLFSRNRKGDAYRLRAAVHCLPETEELQFGERDPLVRWFELHAHLISHVNLVRTQDPNERAIMRRALGMFGAEAIVPLYARGLIIGWIFFGHRVTGRVFDDRDLEGLTILAEHVSTILENALLYEEATVQRALAETLLKSIPPGIVAIDQDATVRWFSPPAEKILGLSGRDVLNQPVERVGNRLASFLREALESKTGVPLQHWIDSNTRRSLSIETRRLADNGSSLGAVAVIQDLTVQETLRERQALVDRATFWTDLAASMSHEIRNPLVAIKTFAHLLANAAEASADRNKPRITLTAKPIREGRQQAAVVVTVRDNGTGIAPEIKDKIFSPFCTTKPRGMGLGLPIVKRTVFDHQGRVEVDSTSKGTEVSVLLPVTGGRD